MSSRAGYVIRRLLLTIPMLLFIYVRLILPGAVTWRDLGLVRLPFGYAVGMRNVREYVAQPCGVRIAAKRLFQERAGGVQAPVGQVQARLQCWSDGIRVDFALQAAKLIGQLLIAELQLLDHASHLPDLRLEAINPQAEIAGRLRDTVAVGVLIATAE